ncbi:MAG: sigma factor [Akkermansiaceae bacterium]
MTSHQSRLDAYALSLRSGRTDAENIMQETNVVLWRKAHDFEFSAKFGGCMLKVAKFRASEASKKIGF